MSTLITPEYLTRIAPRLRAARESAGLSIGQAAHMFGGMTAFNLAQLEAGFLSPFFTNTDEQIDKLCHAYHITRAELESDSLAPISDEDMLKKIKAGLVSDEAFGRWIKIDRQLAKSAQENK